MQSVSSRIWTRVAVSTSYDDNHYTTGTSDYNWYYFNLHILQVFLSSVKVLVYIQFFAFVNSNWNGKLH